MSGLGLRSDHCHGDDDAALRMSRSDAVYGSGLPRGGSLDPLPWPEQRSHAEHPPYAERSAHEHDASRAGDSLFKASPFSVDLSQAQSRSHLERVQTELLLQSRRQDEVFECVAKLERDLSLVAKLTVENEGLHATERQQKQAVLAGLTKRTEEALLTCQTLQRGQEQLVQKVEKLEVLAAEGEKATEQARSLKSEVESMQVTVREKTTMSGHALRRLDAMEQIFDENTRLRQEVAQLRKANERRDMEMAAVQGQIDALTKLVRDQLGGDKLPSSPRR